MVNVGSTFRVRRKRKEAITGMDDGLSQVLAAAFTGLVSGTIGSLIAPWEQALHLSQRDIIR